MTRARCQREHGPLTLLVINPVEILLSIFSFLDSLALVPVLKFHPGIYFLLIVLLVIQAQLEIIQDTAVLFLQISSVVIDNVDAI